jgi:hypothetical protein
MKTGCNSYPSLFATQSVFLAHQTNRELLVARLMRAHAAVIHALGGGFQAGIDASSSLQGKVRP